MSALVLAALGALWFTLAVPLGLLVSGIIGLRELDLQIPPAKEPADKDVATAA